MVGDKPSYVHLLLSSHSLSLSLSQVNTPWVAPACADCAGFLVLGSAPAPASALVSEPQIVPFASIFFYSALGH